MAWGRITAASTRCSPESVGEVPVGVETLGNGDEPYWPQNNNATYREVWVGSACRYAQVLAELRGEEEEDG